MLRMGPGRVVQPRFVLVTLVASEASPSAVISIAVSAGEGSVRCPRLVTGTYFLVKYSKL